MSIKTLAHSSSRFIGKHSPEILTGVALLGVVTTTALTIKATTNASEIIKDIRSNPACEDMTKQEFDKKVLKSIAPEYIPVAASAVATMICIVATHMIQHKRLAALSAAYIISNANFDEYKDAVVKKFGKKKTEEMIGDINRKHILDSPPKDDKIVVLEDGSDTLVYDLNSGRYFRCSIERLRRIESDMNRLLYENDWVSMNDIYDAIGLDSIKLGDEMGFDTANGDTVIFDFGAVLTEDEKPCITLGINPHPRYHIYYGG